MKKKFLLMLSAMLALILFIAAGCIVQTDTKSDDNATTQEKLLLTKQNSDCKNIYLGDTSVKPIGVLVDVSVDIDILGTGTVIGTITFTNYTFTDSTYGTNTISSGKVEFTNTKTLGISVITATGTNIIVSSGQLAGTYNFNITITQVGSLYVISGTINNHSFAKINI